MFTGIVEEVGTILAIDKFPDNAARLHVAGSLVVSDAQLGCSISVNGVCLTVTEFDGSSFCADVMSETLSHTTIGGLTTGVPVNLERAVRVDSRLGGHIVSGHVDCVATVLTRVPSEHWEVFTLGVDPEHARQIALKGSVAVDGVSLTVSGVGSLADGTDTFSVSLIPTTLAETTLGDADVGGRVNIETDVLAKYVQRLLEDGSGQ